MLLNQQLQNNLIVIVVLVTNFSEYCPWKLWKRYYRQVDG